MHKPNTFTVRMVRGVERSSGFDTLKVSPSPIEDIDSAQRAINMPAEPPK